jgi:hypothetical protein
VRHPVGTSHHSLVLFSGLHTVLNYPGNALARVSSPALGSVWSMVPHACVCVPPRPNSSSTVSHQLKPPRTLLTRWHCFTEYNHQLGSTYGFSGPDSQPNPSTRWSPPNHDPEVPDTRFVLGMVAPRAQGSLPKCHPGRCDPLRGPQVNVPGLSGLPGTSSSDHLCTLGEHPSSQRRDTFQEHWEYLELLTHFT